MINNSRLLDNMSFLFEIYSYELFVHKILAQHVCKRAIIYTMKCIDFGFVYACSLRKIRTLSTATFLYNFTFQQFMVVDGSTLVLLSTSNDSQLIIGQRGHDTSTIHFVSNVTSMKLRPGYTL